MTDTTWRGRQAIVFGQQPDGSHGGTFTANTEKSIARTIKMMELAGWTDVHAGPIVNKGDIRPTFDQAPAPADDTPAQDYQAAQAAITAQAAKDATEAPAVADPRPDLPGKPPGSVPAPAKARAPRATKRAAKPAKDDGDPRPRRRGPKTGDPKADAALATK